jgi:small-conductance mechanosensitive channel
MMNYSNTLMAVCFAIIFGTVSLAFGPAMAQSESTDSSTVEVPAALSPEAISTLVLKLDQEQTEALSSLVELLSKSVSMSVSPGDSGDSSTLDNIKEWITGFGDSIVLHVLNVPEMIAALGKGIFSIFDGRGFGGSVLFLALLVLVIAIGMGAEWIFNRVSSDKRDEIRNANPQSLLGTLKVLSARAIIEVGGVAAFTITALLASRLVFSDPTDQFLISAFLLKAILIYRIIAAFLHFILAPHRTELRLVYTDDWTAKYIYKGFAALAGLIGVAFFMLAIIEQNVTTVNNTLRFWISLFAHGWIIYITWNARKGLTSIIKGEEKDLTPGLEKMAAWWPPISMGIVAFNWLLIQFIVSTGYQHLTPARGALAILLIVAMPFLDTIVRGIAAHLVPDVEGEGAVAEKTQRNSRLCYIRVGRVVLLASLVITIGKLWGINLHNLAEGSLGAQFATHSVGFLLIVAIGYMAWEITNLVINRKLALELAASGIEEDAEGEGGEAGGAGQTRMATILPILKITLQVTIVILTVLLALSQIGVNITPLLAGAGVLGLAIGFGAQTLVKDIVSGVFFLLDDAFRLGEYIDVGGTQGTVEKISVRSLQLRGTLGPIHIVPYGSMSQLTNMSRDWVIMKLKFTIPFDTDIEKVRKLFKKIGQEMLADPELADNFLEPFKGQGAADVTDTGIVVRGKFTTRPGDQWVIRKEVYNRVQKAFEENGIEFARKEVRVTMPDAETHDLTQDQQEVIAAAASEAAESPAKPK